MSEENNLSSDHDWKITIQYHRCPKCHFVIESRQDYQYRAGKYEKSIKCCRCHHRFTVQKSSKRHFIPFTGEQANSSSEFDWGAT